MGRARAESIVVAAPARASRPGRVSGKNERRGTTIDFPESTCDVGSSYGSAAGDTRGFAAGSIASSIAIEITGRTLDTAVAKSM